MSVADVYMSVVFAQPVCAAGLRADASGLLVSVSRSISKAADMAQAAVSLRDEINACRATRRLRTKDATDKISPPSSSSSSSSPSAIALASYQEEFIEFAISKNVLQFGNFKLKSGRQSPYFFNAGLFCCGLSLASLGK